MNYEQYDQKVKDTFNRLREKWETIKDTFPLEDRGKWAVLTSTDEVMPFPDLAAATYYRVKHPDIITIVRCIGGEPAVIGPL